VLPGGSLSFYINYTWPQGGIFMIHHRFVCSIHVIGNWLLQRWPLWIWMFMMGAVSGRARFRMVGAQSYDYLYQGSLVWLCMDFSLTCWQRIFAAWTDIRLWPHESRTSRVRRCLTEAWRASTRRGRFVVIFEIVLYVFLLVIPRVLFT
jgi:hypothetical protein